MMQAVISATARPAWDSGFGLEERLAACGDPGRAPTQLAELFRLTFEPSKQAKLLRKRLQSTLLRWTIDKARRHTQHYATYSYDELSEVTSVLDHDLSFWPLLSRHEVAKSLASFHADNVTFGGVSHTSGCTGEPLSVYRSNEELRFLWNYQSQLLLPVRRKLATIPLVLSLPNLYHGAAVPVPSLGKAFAGGVTDDLLLEDLIKTLRRRFCIPGHDERFSIITGLVHQIMFLTSYLLEQGIDPREFGVKSINLVGGYSPRQRREYLSKAWGAVIFDRFSLTESAAGATRCHACELFHLDPHVIGEIVEMESDAAVQQGVGRLVLTQLYPFVQMQPFVRYDTGDLVRRMPSTCEAGLSFEFVGKAANCVGHARNGRTQWLVLSVPLLEILDAIPDFSRLEQFRGVHTANDPSVGSLPIYTLVASKPQPNLQRICLTLELRYAPSFYPARVQDLERKIRAGLMVAHPALAQGVDDGSVELVIAFAGPKTLSGAGMLKV